jgi:type III restriction enzyme
VTTRSGRSACDGAILKKKLNKTKKLKLPKLKKGQSKFNVIITGQIYSHAGKENASANILTELQKQKYINHIVGCSPREILTCDNILQKLEEYLTTKHKKAG